MLFQLKNLQSRSASAENLQAKVGGGGVINNGRKGSPCIWPLKAGNTYVLLDTVGMGMIRHIWCTIPPGNIMHMRNIILRMYWDDQEQPSVEVPLGDFFGAAHGRQRNIVTEYISMQDGKGFNCWIPMPFKKRAVITVENDSDTDVAMFFYQIDFTLGDEISDDAGYFHAQFRRMNPCPIKTDYTLIDGISGKGKFMGAVIGVRSLYSKGWWGEGEVKFFIDDDDKYPTICGTGTEDYMGSAWGLGEIVTPYQGCPLSDNTNGLYSIYRFHIKDPIYFQKRIKVTLQQIGFGQENDAREHYKSDFVRYHAAGLNPNDSVCYFERSDDICSVSYWYQTLPTSKFPVLPSREERSANLLIDQENGPKRSDI